MVTQVKKCLKDEGNTRMENLETSGTDLPETIESFGELLKFFRRRKG